MSLNTAHVEPTGVLLYAGERILLFCKDTTLDLYNNKNPAFTWAKSGRLYLTTHRMIFTSHKRTELFQSFSFPFCTLKEVELEQPVFGANYIKGKVKAQPDGNWTGEAKFKLIFSCGGAIEFGQAMLRAARLAMRSGTFADSPPPYTPPASWNAAPPPMYTAPAAGYYGWVPPTHRFPDAPEANSVFAADLPPPYPGIDQPAYQYPGQASAPPMGFYDPSNPQNAYVPQGAHHQPPSYEEAVKKKQ